MTTTKKQHPFFAKKTVKFPAKVNKADFGAVVKERVHAYFKENNLSRHATPIVHLKTAGLFIALAILYFVILMETVSPPALLGLCVVIGVIQGLIGVNIAHDALHGSYSSRSSINHFLGHAFDLVGPSSLIWKSTHNFNHHIYTNIPGLDHDIDKGAALCLSPKDEPHWYHRFQHLYIGFLYCLTTINWIFYSDYIFFFQERKRKKFPTRTTVEFFLFKALNFVVFIGIPLAVMTLPWWQILLGCFIFQCAGGMTVAIIFQLAHLVEHVEFPEPDPEGLMGNQWADHEMMTTANFGTHNIWLTHIVGGLNFQIEHHLFPYVSHVHYPSIAPIVRKTAKEFGLPYHENPSFFSALGSHLRILKKFGGG